MVGRVEVRLQLVAGDPNLTFIFFIALTLLAVLGLRFGFYAYRNRQQSDLVAEHRLWDFLSIVGLLAVAFALLGILEIVTTAVLPFKQAFLLALLLLLTVTMRSLYESVIPTTTDGNDRYQKTLTQAAVLSVAVVFIGMLLVGRHPALVATMGTSSLAFAAVGVAFGRRGATATRVQGTVIDTLLRHLLPVLLFGALVPAVELATLAGLDRAIVLHVQVVFIIMTAATLMTATIKLRQNLASL